MGHIITAVSVICNERTEDDRNARNMYVNIKLTACVPVLGNFSFPVYLWQTRAQSKFRQGGSTWHHMISQLPNHCAWRQKPYRSSSPRERWPINRTVVVLHGTMVNLFGAINRLANRDYKHTQQTDRSKSHHLGEWEWLNQNH